MKTSWQDLLDQLIHAEGGKYLPAHRREKFIIETVMGVLEATLEKLRDQDAT